MSSLLPLHPVHIPTNNQTTFQTTHNDIATNGLFYDPYTIAPGNSRQMHSFAFHRFVILPWSRTVSVPTFSCVSFRRLIS
ncbi:hypothetical protein J007_06230 [Cryptococcus neoformans]|nr:hypothetical protein C356_06309 [Cryptococcus neoformans var. grubii c45]OXB34147.1 hypothetical protein J007_06230 [Cryptococcus neoformans var. grubii]OXC58238.1 hypothetical protein C358_06322 [Cryptococcus neoformans var. grubii MW-RSA852]